MPETAALYTIGYEGKAVRDFVQDLRANGVEVLVDVREMPVSRKPGFSKTKLASFVNEAEIEYVHLKSLGSPKEARQKLKDSGDFEGFSHEYLDHLAGSSKDLRELENLISSGKKAALMCFEQDHTQCHRTLLVTELVREMGLDLDVYHL